VLLDMAKNLCNQPRILDGGDASEFATALGTGLDVDGKDALEALPPACEGEQLAKVDVLGASGRSGAHLCRAQ